MLSVGYLQGRTTSYADVVAFEAGLHGAAPSAGLSSGPFRPREASRVSVSNPERVVLDQEIADEIFNTTEEFSSLVAIFHFRGL